MSEAPSMLVIACKCGQKMKVPADSQGKVFKCVRCASAVHMPPGATPAPPPKAKPKLSQEPKAQPRAQPRGGDPAGGPEYRRIGELLIDEGLITDEQLQQALALQKESGGKTFEILLREKFLDKEELHSFLSKKSGVPAIELKRLRIEPELVQLIPRDIAMEQYVLPIDKLGRLLTVAMACPIDKRTIAEIEQLTGLRVKAMLARLDEIHAAVNKYYPKEGEEGRETFIMGLIPIATAGKKEEVGEKVGELANLPAPAKLLDRLESLGADGVRDAARLAQTDAPMAATLLSLANSAAYGMTGRVDSAPMAVALLGWPGVKAACARCREAAQIKESGPWRERALRSARIAGALAGVTGGVSPSAAYTAGLLHELGRFVLASVAPQKYRHIDAGLVCEALLKEEEKSFSLNHVEAGSNLAMRWHLPNGINEALRCYLDPSSAGEAAAALTRIVAVAAHLGASGNGLTPELLEPCAESLAALKLDAATALSEAERALESLVS